MFWFLIEMFTQTACLVPSPRGCQVHLSPHGCGCVGDGRKHVSTPTHIHGQGRQQAAAFRELSLQHWWKTSPEGGDGVGGGWGTRPPFLLLLLLLPQATRVRAAMQEPGARQSHLGNLESETTEPRGLWLWGDWGPEREKKAASLWDESGHRGNRIVWSIRSWRTIWARSDSVNPPPPWPGLLQPPLGWGWMLSPGTITHKSAGNLDPSNPTSLSPFSPSLWLL